MDLKNTKTQKNLEQAFIDEATSIVKYLIFADHAKENGNIEIENIFNKIAKSEIEHAKVCYKHLFDISKNSISDNLNASALEENKQWKEQYPDYANTARQEGFPTVSMMFERLASIECNHERSFFEAEANLENDKIVLDEQTSKENYFCIICGSQATKNEQVCKVCGATNSFSK